MGVVAPKVLWGLLLPVLSGNERHPLYMGRVRCGCGRFGLRFGVAGCVSDEVGCYCSLKQRI